MHTASSAKRTKGALRSASEYTATVADAHFAGGAHDAQGDLATVGDEEFLDLLVGHVPVQGLRRCEALA
jgi:hypothetical protein